MQDRVIPFVHQATRYELVLPASPEELIDRESFEADERMPYWADLWPAAMALSRHIVEMSAMPPRAIELGCGVGLVSLALLSRGVKVVATDYEELALGYVIRNAAHNGLPEPETAVLDWRSPAGVAPAPLVVAADVLYEPHHAPALANCFDLLVAPGGRGLIADPGRKQLATILELLRERGWTTRRIDERGEEPTAASVLGNPRPSTVQIHELLPPVNRTSPTVPSN